MSAVAIRALPSPPAGCSNSARARSWSRRPATSPTTGRSSIIKELIDNALDACEEAGIAPVIRVTVARGKIRVRDNGPGIPPETVASILDFTTRTSSREAYVAPDRGRQGNALKTILAMPFALSGEEGRVEIVARGIRHEITFRVDRIAQQPVIDHQQHRWMRFGKNRHRDHGALARIQHAQTWRTPAAQFLPLVQRLHRSEPAPEPVRHLGRRRRAASNGRTRRSTRTGRSGRHRRRPRRTGIGSPISSASPAPSCPMTASARPSASCATSSPSSTG